MGTIRRIVDFILYCRSSANFYSHGNLSLVLGYIYDEFGPVSQSEADFGASQQVIKAMARHSMLKGLILITCAAARSKHLVSIVSPTSAHTISNDSHNYTECQKAKFTENDRFKVKLKQN